MFVFLQHGLSIPSWRRSKDDAQLNSPTPYGYGAAGAVVDLTWSEDADEGRVSRFVRLGSRRVLGFDFVHAWRNRRGLSRAEVVWTHTERESLAALMLLRLLRNRSTRVIAQTVWLWDNWQTIRGFRRRLYLSLLRDAAVEVTLSTLNRDAARAARGTDEVLCLPFGAAVNESTLERALRTVAPGAGGGVLAMGRDRHRDWSTLHAAARLLPDIDFWVATVDAAYPTHDAPPNVRIEPIGSLDEVYRAYAEAAVVVIPLVPNLHASGCTVALETQHVGSSLVTTDVGGLGLYLVGSRVAQYETGNAAALADAILAEYDRAADGPDPDGLKQIRAQGLTSDDYVARYVILTRALLAGAPLPYEVEATVSVRDILTP
ncbi:glycosyltransferase family protein [Actinopolymorpha cephalotaxi]|uniref:Glycosyltransferase involved in cell wall biosynthesis n=1 Tax=Actinopolymorpha cephalotaxi TaxID=504797 RepID=A0ABX2S648_9ACTN|nr:glycosyltransferase [Actinopolymorpha cephalotaxi]NYH85105.1 glycosyltransferase involved in cell wall biosynthesis [Actinopolymorpha cephalotaxi]